MAYMLRSSSSVVLSKTTSLNTLSMVGRMVILLMHETTRLTTDLKHLLFLPRDARSDMTLIPTMTGDGINDDGKGRLISNTGFACFDRDLREVERICCE